MQILNAHIGLSYLCNMRCEHCFVNKKEDRLCLDDFKRIIDILYDIGVICLFYTYGEPLLWQDLTEAILYASNKGFYQTLMTNGSMITKENVIQLEKNGLNQAYVSIDNVDSKKHDKNRRYVGAYSKAIEALELLSESSIKTGIACTVSPNNISSMWDIYLLGKRIGIDQISFLRERAEHKIVEVNEVEYQKNVYQMLLDHKIKTIYHDSNLNPVFKRAYDEQLISKMEYTILVGQGNCYTSSTVCIEPSGDVSRCNLNPYIIGNIHRDDLKKILLENKSLCCY